MLTYLFIVGVVIVLVMLLWLGAALMLSGMLSRIEEGEEEKEERE